MIQSFSLHLQKIASTAEWRAEQLQQKPANCKKQIVGFDEKAEIRRPFGKTVFRKA
ncbi:MAG: hypothetical protein MUC59_02565 [Saprospiraceae bacterium]|nr:hypothetical protein [Saprospiraceae bacterium]